MLFLKGGNRYKKGSPPPDLSPQQREALYHKIEDILKTRPADMTKAAAAAATSQGQSSEVSSEDDEVGSSDGLT